MNELFRRPGEEEFVVVHLAAGESLARSIPSGSSFVCGVILDDSDWSSEWLSALVEDLIRNGAAYLAFFGAGCEEAHDIADVVREMFPVPDENDVVMTTWHASESLVDYLWFVLFTAWPSEGYGFNVRRRCILDIGREARPGLVAAVQELAAA
jgi:hypothetical protein